MILTPSLKRETFRLTTLGVGYWLRELSKILQIKATLPFLTLFNGGSNTLEQFQSQVS